VARRVYSQAATEHDRRNGRDSDQTCSTIKVLTQVAARGRSLLSTIALLVGCRENEDAFVQQRDERKPGGEWERVCRLCDFNPKSSRNAKDITRMRSILLQLKQAPAAATADS